MPTPVLWKNAFQANTGDAGIGVQVEPRIIGLANGRILVVWTESSSGVIGTGAGSDIVGRLFNSVGSPLSGFFQINTRSTVDDEQDFDIAPTNDGGFVIVYVDDDISSPNQTGIVWERYDESAAAVDTQLIAVENVGADDLANPQVTVNQLTNVSLVTFTNDVGADTDIRAVTVSAAGVVSAEFDAALNSADFDGDGDVAILANGNFVSVYREGGAGIGAQARIMTSAGGAIATFDLSTEPVDAVSVATLLNGNWVAAWCETTGGNADIRYQVFTAAGNPVSGTLFAAAGANSQNSPDIVALPDGGFVIVWDDDTAGELLARRFNADGSGDGTLFTVATGADSTPDVAVTPDGRILFTWKDGETAEIFASIWDPRGAVINAADYQLGARNFVDAQVVHGRPTATTLNANDTAAVLLIGGADNDILIGSANGHTLSGTQGNDTYFVNGAGVGVIEVAGFGDDIVYASVSFALADLQHIETLATANQSGIFAQDLTGNDVGQSIFGNNGTNILRGEGGNDTLFGFGGTDFLVGGAGTDIMVGGIGDDTYYIDDTSDAISEFAGQGFDRLATVITLALAADADIERLDVENLGSTNALDLTGSAIANVIYGNDGQNILRGEAGNDELRGFGGNDFLVGGTGTDLMVGGAGDDTFYVDDASDAIGEISGDGNDRIAASVSFVLSNGANVELLEAVNLLATTAFDLTGSDSANTITGNNGVNFLRGEGGNDILSGAGGDDFLVGGTGIDTMTGGTGNDTYYVDNLFDTVNEFAGEGTGDRVAASATYFLSANADIERLEAATQTTTNAMDLIGSSIANIILGNDGVNVLDGKGGSDTLTGFGGADSFQFTTALGAGNIDTIIGFTGGSDKIRIENAIFTGLSAGALPASAFRVDSAAQDADDRILYNSQTGQLFFDADGNGAGAAVQFATLQGAPSLVASDFTVI